MNTDGIPIGSPLVYGGPYAFEDSRMHLFILKVDREAMSANLPQGFSLREPACLWIAASRHYKVRARGGPRRGQAFDDVTLLTPVRHDKMNAAAFFCLYGYSNLDTAVATGREVYGMPYKGGHISLAYDEKTRVFECRLFRRNVSLIHVKARGMEGGPPEKFPAPYFHGMNPWKGARGTAPDILLLSRKNILDVEGKGSQIREITAVSPAFHHALPCVSYAKESVSVEFGSLAEDPLRGLGEIQEVVAAFQCACTFTLPYGSVIPKEPRSNG